MSENKEEIQNIFILLQKREECDSGC